MSVPSQTVCSMSHCGFVLLLSLHCSNSQRDQNFADLGKFMAHVTILWTVVMDGTVECMFVAEFILIPL